MQAVQELDDKPLPAVMWLEAYRPRGTAFSQDGPMLALQALILIDLPGVRVLNNMGIKKVVTQPFMEALGLWKFMTPTNHQDLRSAARIMLLGALKEDYLNKVLYGIIVAKLNNIAWEQV